MKNIFLTLLLLFSTSLFGQYTTTKVMTNTSCTSKMIYDYKNKKWDFVPNQDLATYKTIWIFNITDRNTGMISNGDINYDILSYSKVNDAAYLKVYNTFLKRNMEIIIKKTDDVLSIVIFDVEQRVSYYFF
jgi:hypothetical protein